MAYTDFYFYPKLIALLLVVGMIQLLFKRKQQFVHTFSKIILLAFSFYTLWYYNVGYVVCISAVVLIVYFSGLLIGCSEGKVRKYSTVISVVILVVFLGIFKYLNFFAGTFCNVVGVNWTELNLILPLGISFYIFSAISYILDVSWGNMEAEKSLLNVALFLAFFPKLVCGPIVKGHEFIPQLREYRKIEWKNVCTGAQIFVLGLFKKLVLADHLAVFVDDVYSKPAAFDNITIWLAVFSYFLQLYFDFSGYSDMAIGVFKMFGYDVAPNFNLPFVSTTISEFWNRWHIFLGSWLNDYVFNPLAIKFKRSMSGWDKAAQKKYKMLPSYAACIFTFLISGIWHGAGMTFIVFGLLHGVSSVIQQMYDRWCKKNKKERTAEKGRMYYTIDILLNYILVTFIQVFFRADSVSGALHIFKLMFVPHVGMNQIYTWSIFAYIVLIVATILAYRHSHSNYREIQGYYPIQDLSTVKGMTIFFVLCGLTIIMGYFGQTYFIYGQF